MAIDLARCNGCACCSVNCSQTNRLPPALPWRRVPGLEVGADPQPRRVFLSLACMHCAQAPCEEVCPSGATYRRPDGIVDIRHSICLGCGYCVVACPYYARTLVPRSHARDAGLLGRPPDDGAAAASGVCTKCDFCAATIDAGLARGLQPGVDPEASPACVNTCLPKAIHFGDLDDPESNVARLLRDRRAVRVSEELGTAPAVYYLFDPVGD